MDRTRSENRLGALRKCAGIIDDYALEQSPAYRAMAIQQRRRDVVNASNQAGAHGTANAIAEQVGGVTGKLVGAGIGGAAGHLLTRNSGADKHVLGTVGGAVAGVALPVLIASIVAGIRRKRTKDEQIKADSAGRAVAKYVVPGLSTYDSFKRVGASEHYQRRLARRAKLGLEKDAGIVSQVAKVLRSPQSTKRLAMLKNMFTSVGKAAPAKAFKEVEPPWVSELEGIGELNPGGGLFF